MEPEDINGGVESASTSARIKALDSLTASNLRKTQVINKVADIVRELVENSLDAGATTIQVYVDKYGKDRIEVRDNGHGLDSDEVKQIFRGGHTSKLQDASNLSRGKYLGFRGEALNAMCAVANVTLVSKSAKQSTGVKYKFDPLGNVISEQKMAHSGGSTVTVENLFENIPVRRQRLNNAANGSSELKEIEAFLKAAGIANPNCHISMFHNTTLVWTKAAVQTIEQALFSVLGFSIAKRLKKIGPIRIDADNDHHEEENATERKVELYLPTKPVDMRTMSYTSNKMAMIFCNQKRVYIRELEKLIHRYVTANVEKPQPADQRRFPVSAVYITVPPREADFNLDMDKTKVFLVHKDKILEAIENALIKFYGVDLRACAEVAQESSSTLTEPPQLKDGGNESDVETSCSPVHKELEEENTRSFPNKETGRDEPTTNSTVRKCAQEKNDKTCTSTVTSPDISRQCTIAAFLQNIPSTSTAFSQSPSKLKNSEPVTVEFPISKPMVDTQQIREDTIKKLNFPKNPGRSIVSNFEISVDSQELLFDFEEPSSKTDVAKPVIDAEKPQPEQISAEASTDKLKNWLDGRIVDKFGDVIENVVTVNPVVPSTKEPDSERFRSALLAGASNPNRSTRMDPQSSPFPHMNAMEPPAKKIRCEATGIHPCPSPVISYAPRMPTPKTPTHRQATLDSLTNWQASTGGFSQTASRSVVGVRIPLIPKQPEHNSRAIHRDFDKTFSKTNEFSRFSSFQQQEHQKSLFTAAQRWPCNNNAPAKKLQPQIHREITGRDTGAFGQLYFAQTYDSLGVFCPLNMIEYFPNESRECWSNSTSGNKSLSSEDVSRMFKQFVDRSKFNKAPISGKIFHVICRLPDLSQVLSHNLKLM